jgi:hypothetical protein
MSDMAYAVHTRSCTYLLDDDGVCRWTLAPTGVPVPGADRYLGAQFVACLDVREQGGLVGELRVGAAALFARSEDGRFVLLRTPPIEFVEHRDDDASAEPSPPQYTPYQEPPPAYAPRPTAAPPVYAAPEHAAPPAAPVYAAPVYSAPAYPAPAYSPPAYRAPPEPEPESVATAPLPWPAVPPWPRPAAPAYAPEPELALDDADLDVEELVTFSEVTLTIPLYRPEARKSAPPLPRRGVIGPGRRLR